MVSIGKCRSRLITIKTSWVLNLMTSPILLAGKNWKWNSLFLNIHLKLSEEIHILSHSKKKYLFSTILKEPWQHSSDYINIGDLKDWNIRNINESWYRWHGDTYTTYVDTHHICRYICTLMCMYITLCLHDVCISLIRINQMRKMKRSRRSENGWGEFSVLLGQ